MSAFIYNNSSLALSKNEFRDAVNHYLTSVNYIISFVQVFICSSGVLGNLSALIVVNRKSLKNTSSAVFITYMAIFDSAVLLLHAANLVKPRGSPYLHCSLIYLTDLSTFCANWILVIITLERCMAVYFPFLAKRFCTANSARFSMYILLTISLIFFTVTFPFLFHTNKPAKNQKCSVRRGASLILRIYQPILLYGIPDLFLLSNLFTVYALCRRHQRLLSSHLNNEQKFEIRITDIHSNRKQKQLTIMLVTVSLSFYLFTTPAMILYINEYFKPTKPRTLAKMKQNILFGQISVVLLQLNNATNFLFYCFAGQRFRKATMETLYDYSTHCKIFYHRYILCDKEYRPIPNSQYQLSYTRRTTMSNRESCSPNNQRHHHHHHHHHRTSTI